MWDQHALEQYVHDGVEESLNLEYKAAAALGRSDGKKKEITKDVSALANADGGLLVYGITEYQEADKRHLPERIDPINRMEFSREWLEQVINTIRPKIDGLLIHAITINDNPQQVVYVVEVPQSTTVHQARDKRYYKRFNFESVPMDDYEIRDVMARAQHPQVSLQFRIVVENVAKSLFDDYSRQLGVTQHKDYTLVVTARNTGRVYAQYVNAFITVPDAILTPDPHGIRETVVENSVRYHRIYRDNTIRDPLGTNAYGPSRFDPILPGLTHSWPIELTPTFGELNLNDLLIRWQVHADNALSTSGEVAVATVEWVEQRK